jgi:putative ABC transport system permease protein
MLLESSIKQALRNLRAQKMRAFLTMLGIIIGISSVIMITSAIHGAESLIVNQIEGLGANIIGVLPGKSDDGGPPAAVMGIVITTLRDSDVEEIRKRVPNVEAVSAYVSATEVVNWGNQKTVGQVYGVSPDYPNISDAELESGYFFTEEHKRTNANVAILGSDIKDDLFEGVDPIGEKITVKNTKLTIIGVMEPIGTVGFTNADTMVFVPVTTAQKRILGINHIGFSRIRVNHEDNIPQVMADVEDILRARHNIKDPAKDDFTIESTSEALKSLDQITGALNFLLVAIVFISLIVGGIGIMNIMLAAVTQRIKEIGLRKSVGATKLHIIYQFLAETLVLTMIGAIIGIIIGILISLLISLLVNWLGYDWDFIITPGSVIIACLVSFVVGIVFGLYPANKASKLDPITSLRYE